MLIIYSGLAMVYCIVLPSVITIVTVYVGSQHRTNLTVYPNESHDYMLLYIIPYFGKPRDLLAACFMLVSVLVNSSTLKMEEPDAVFISYFPHKHHMFRSSHFFFI
jgi:hypothetical protein